MNRLHWHDIERRSKPGQWDALMLTVSGKSSPGTRVSVFHALCIRVATNRIPRIWARIESDYWGYNLLRAHTDATIGAIPAIPFTQVRELSPDSTPDEFDRYWARKYARLLVDSSTSPLTDGQWVLRRFVDGEIYRTIPLAMLERIVNQKSSGFIQWDFGDSIFPITLRNMSSPEGGRVRALRKLAHAGSLPPVLLYWVSGLAAYVVLDGHDRLLAANLESVAMPALALEMASLQNASQSTRHAVLHQVSTALINSERARTRASTDRLARAQRLLTVEDANRLLLDVFVPKLQTAPTQAAILEGGYAQWSSEVRAEVHSQGLDHGGLLNPIDKSELGA